MPILKNSGAEWVEAVEIPSAGTGWNYDVLTYEFKRDLNAYLSQLAPSAITRSLKDLIRFNQENSEEMLRYGQIQLIRSEETSESLTEPAYIEALEFDFYHATEQGIDYAFEKDQLDVIVFPSDEGSHISAKAGYPSIAVPVGFTSSGEPVGITFAGTAYSEPVLIEIAYAFEQLTKARKAPKLGFE